MHDVCGTNFAAGAVGCQWGEASSGRFRNILAGSRPQGKWTQEKAKMAQLWGHKIGPQDKHGGRGAEGGWCCFLFFSSLSKSILIRNKLIFPNVSLFHLIVIGKHVSMSAHELFLSFLPPVLLRNESNRAAGCSPSSQQRWTCHKPTKLSQSRI